MEFSSNINNLLADTIIKLDNNITPARRNAEGYSQNELRSQLLLVIDKMGDASSKAQGLYTTITTGRKLQLSDHTLYVMKDASGNGGRGTVVGILKIGHKKLFVYSNHGNVHEMEPLCVLDFYVHESRQRMGCGRKLFDFMLEDMGVKACHLPIDKPSFKFSQFLNKHYHLRAEIPQVNNFVVFEGFFSNRTDIVPKRRSAIGRPPHHPGRQREELLEDGVLRQHTYNGYGLLPLPPTKPLLGQGSGNQFMGPSSRPPSGSSSKARSASVMTTPRREIVNLEYQRNGQLRPISNLDEDEARSVSAHVVRSKGKQIYSRHVNNPESPIGSIAGSRPSSGHSPVINGLNTINGGLNLNSRLNRNQVAHNSDPPLLKRGTTTDDYSMDQFNLHQTYQGRQGHIKVTSGYEQPIRNPFFSREEEVANGAWQQPREETKWTLFDTEPSYLSLAKRNYTHTRLW